MSRVWSAATVALLVLTACTKAELPDPEPTGITVTIDKSTLSADDGSITAQAVVYEDGVALLDYPVSFSLSGAVTVPAVTQNTDPTTGVATHTFTDVRTTGAALGTPTSVSFNVSAVGVNGSAPFTVVPGAVTAISIAPSATTQNADVGSLSVTSSAVDAYANVVGGAPIVLSSNVPGATFVGTQFGNVRVAGSWLVTGTLAGSPAIVDTAGLLVTPGAPTQIQSSLGQPVVGQLETITIYCREMDAYANDTFATFTAGTEVRTNPASTITAVSSTAFTASGFTAAGVYEATCQNGALSDTTDFQVVAQNATNSVLATVDVSQIQAGMTATLLCREFDQFGNETTATFANGTEAVLLSNDTPPDPLPTLTGPTGKTFTIGNTVFEGPFIARCTKNGISDDDDFSVIDTIAPTITSFRIDLATPHNPSTLPPYDGRHGDEDLTFRIEATDVTGISSVATIVSNGLAVYETASSIFEPGPPYPSPASYDFRIDVDPGNVTFSTITFRAQVRDGGGNATLQELTWTFDPGASLAAPAGITIRTHFQAGGGDSSFAAISTSSASIYAKRINPAFDGSDQIVRIGGEGTAFTSIATDFVPGDDQSTLGLLHVPGGFGGNNMFHTLVGSTGNLAAFTGSTPVLHSTVPTFPVDITYRAAASLYYIERGVGGALPPSIFSVDALGGTSLFYDDTVPNQMPGAGAILALGSDLLIADTGGRILRLDPAAALTTFADVLVGHQALDMCVGAGSKVLVAGGSVGVNGTVFRITSAGVVEAALNGFDDAIGVTADAAGTLYVLDAGTAPARIYRVTGY